MTHLTRDELDRWHRDGAPADRRRIVEHLAACDACGAMLADVRDAARSTGAADPDLVNDMKTLGYRAYRATPPVTSMRTWRRAAVFVTAAAALVLIAVFVPFGRSPAGTGDDTAVRGSAIQLLAPAGTVTAIDRFRWTSPVRATRYRVEVYDAGQRKIAEVETTAEDVSVPDDRRPALRGPGEYTWIVVALDAAGAEIMRSLPQRVVVSGAAGR